MKSNNNNNDDGGGGGCRGTPCSSASLSELNHGQDMVAMVKNEIISYFSYVLLMLLNECKKVAWKAYRLAFMLKKTHIKAMQTHCTYNLLRKLHSKRTNTLASKKTKNNKERNKHTLLFSFSKHSTRLKLFLPVATWKRKITKQQQVDPTLAGIKKNQIFSIIHLLLSYC